MPWEHSIEISIPFWAVRPVAGLLMFAGYLVFLVNIVQTYLASQADAPGSGRRRRVSVADRLETTGFIARGFACPCWKRNRASCSSPGSASSPWRSSPTPWCRS